MEWGARPRGIDFTFPVTIKLIDEDRGSHFEEQAVSDVSAEDLPGEGEALKEDEPLGEVDHAEEELHGEMDGQLDPHDEPRISVGHEKKVQVGYLLTYGRGFEGITFLSMWGYFSSLVLAGGSKRDEVS